MGQGIHSTLATLVCEELDVLLSDVIVEHGPPSEVYSNDRMLLPLTWKRQAYERVKGILSGTNSVYTRQLTGGQSSTQDAFVKMRKAGAIARTVLIHAAALEWGTSPDALSTSNGFVLGADGKKSAYTKLAEVAASIDPSTDPILKPREQWQQLGHSQPRVDMREKCTGNAVYSIDVRLPGMFYGTVRRNPHLGGVMKSFQAERALGMTGVRKVVPLEDGVLVIATNTWYAFKASEAVDIVWGDAPYPPTSDEHRESVRTAIASAPTNQPRNDGNVEQDMPGTRIVEGEYWVPYLAHATMEPLNAVARFQNGHLDIWAGTQFPTQAQAIAADLLDLDIEDVSVHTTLMGGGFGRRLENDFIKTAVYAARAMKGSPVKVTWSREEDMTHDTYRPLAMATFRARVRDRVPMSLDLNVASPSLFSSISRRENGPDTKLQKFIVAGAWEQPYDIENYRVSGYQVPDLLTIGWWRSVGESQNIFFHESIMDELAYEANVDPLQMRLNLISHPSSTEVLVAVARMSNWGAALPNGHAHGLAYALSSGAATAQVAEIEHTGKGIKIHKIFVAIDVGIALDPRNIEAQIQSSVIFGLSAAINGEISVKDGKVVQTNFHDYAPLRIHQTPDIQVQIIESGEEIFGVGESGTATAAPALGNAIFAATRKRIRELPFSHSIQIL